MIAYISQSQMNDTKRQIKDQCKQTCDERIKRLKVDIVEGLGEMAWHELH
jgi:hypothetical protein